MESSLKYCYYSYTDLVVLSLKKNNKLQRKHVNASVLRTDASQRTSKFSKRGQTLSEVESLWKLADLQAALTRTESIFGSLTTYRGYNFLFRLGLSLCQHDLWTAWLDATGQRGSPTLNRIHTVYSSINNSFTLVISSF